MDTRLKVPILVGITGKLNFEDGGKGVRAALQDCFALLDDRFRDSPKTLMTGLAIGADMIAAEVALERGWAIVGVLPFRLDEYLKNYSDDAAGKLRDLLARDRVTTIVLDPLRDPATGAPSTIDALQPGPDCSSNPLRSRHYEQAGFFIAERCALLIAVMPVDEPPTKVGGTSRVVHFRLEGAFEDADAKLTVKASKHLRSVSIFDEPLSGPVWLIEPGSAVSGSAPLVGIDLYAPKVEKFDEDPSSAGKAEFSPLDSMLKRRSRLQALMSRLLRYRKDWLVGPLHLVDGLNSLNSLIPGIDADPAMQQGAAPPADASAFVRSVRNQVAGVQGSKKRKMQYSVLALAVFFFLAILGLEAHAEFKWHSAFYIVAIAVILIVYGWARILRLQQYTEDYRAVAEALRVQIAWWDSGLHGRASEVYQHFLVGAAGSLGVVRAAVRQIVDAALIACPPPRANLTDLSGWIDRQAAFFRDRVRSRERNLAMTDAAVWLLFMASIGAAIGLWPRLLEHLLAVHWFGKYWIAALILSPVVAIAAAFGSSIGQHAIRRRLRTLSHLSALLCGFLLATLVEYALGEHAVSPPPADAHAVTEHVVSTAHKVMVMLTVMMATVSGAVRYLAENFAWEAELHRYREALAMFERLKRRGRPDISQGALSEQEARNVFELGKLALNESESWILAHRVRPLEPMH